MKPGLFHITLSMIRINGDAGIEEAKQLMADIKEDFDRIIKSQQCSLVVNDIDTFGQRVLYAKVKPNPIDIYDNIYAMVQNRLDMSKNISSTNKFQSNTKL